MFQTSVPAVHVIDVDNMHDEENALNTPERSIVCEEPQTISVASPADKEDGNINGNTQPRPFDELTRTDPFSPRKQPFWSPPAPSPAWALSGSPSAALRQPRRSCPTWRLNVTQRTEAKVRAKGQGRSPRRQLNNGVSRNWASSSSSQEVIAATIKLEWTGVVIRVRCGKDRDWMVVMRELQKTWAVASQQQKQSNPEPCIRDLNGGEGEKEEGLKISVILHIVG